MSFCTLVLFPVLAEWNRCTGPHIPHIHRVCSLEIIYNTSEQCCQVQFLLTSMLPRKSMALSILLLYTSPIFLFIRNLNIFQASQVCYKLLRPACTLKRKLEVLSQAQTVLPIPELVLSHLLEHAQCREGSRDSLLGNDAGKNVCATSTCS